MLEFPKYIEIRGEVYLSKKDFLNLNNKLSTKEKFSKEDELAKKGAVLMREHALLGRVGDVIPMSPPLCITSDEIDEFIGRMDLILGKLSNQLG